MKKSFKKTVILTLVVILGALMSLTSVTYAWFTASNTASVDQIDVKVQSAGGLEISGKAEGSNALVWSSNLNTYSLTGNKKLKPVSGYLNAGELSFFQCSFVQKSDDGEYYINKFATATVTEGYEPYISFEIALRNAGINKVEINFDGTELTGLSAKAVRIAFKVGTAQTYVPTGDDATTWEHLTSYSSVNNDVTIYEKDASACSVIKAAADAVEETTDTLYEQSTGDKYVKVTRTADSDPVTTSGSYFVWKADNNEKVGFNAYAVSDDYVLLTDEEALTLKTSGIVLYCEDDGVYTQDLATFDADKEYYQQVLATVYEKVTFATQDTTQKFAAQTTVNDIATTIATIPANSVLPIKVYIWIEGQDVDCTNEIAGQAFSLNLKFNADDVSSN